MATGCCEGQKDKWVKKIIRQMIRKKKDPLRAIKHKDVHAASGSGNLNATDCLQMRGYTKKMLYSSLFMKLFS